VQTAYVQFLRLPGDATYVEFVAPDRPDSKLAAALAKGGGLNHLCYAVDDLDAACRDLRAGGLFPLAAPVPAAAFGGRRIAWFLGRDRMPVELVERGPAGAL
jgi:methylmalonyl-CoA/ethylmalonyl-CoA epimerase